MIRPRVSAAVFAAWLGAMGLYGGQSLQAGTVKTVEGLEPGQRPPDFLLSDLSGTPQTLAQYRGQVVVLHFWATWCPYCRAEIPKLVEAHHQWASGRVMILAVSVDRHREQLVTFVNTAKLPYAVAADIDASASLARRYHVSSLPTTVIIGRDGRIVSRLTGSADIHGEIERVLAAPTRPRA